MSPIRRPIFTGILHAGREALLVKVRVPWWPPERRDLTLHRILVHLIAEIHRHTGHTDMVRDL